MNYELHAFSLMHSPAACGVISVWVMRSDPSQSLCVHRQRQEKPLLRFVVCEPSAYKTWNPV